MRQRVCQRSSHLFARCPTVGDIGVAIQSCANTSTNQQPCDTYAAKSQGKSFGRQHYSIGIYSAINSLHQALVCCRVWKRVIHDTPSIFDIVVLRTSVTTFNSASLTIA